MPVRGLFAAMSQIHINKARFDLDIPKPLEVYVLYKVIFSIFTENK